MAQISDDPTLVATVLPDAASGRPHALGDVGLRQPELAAPVLPPASLLGAPRHPLPHTLSLPKPRPRTYGDYPR